MMHRLLELETREPAAIQLGPSRPPVMAPLAQQEPRELLACPAQRMHRIETGAHQVAYRFVSGIRNPYRRQLARSMQPRQTGCIPPIRLDPVARAPRDQRGSYDDAFVAVPRHVTLNAIAARPRLVAEPKPDAPAAEPAHQPIQRCRRVRDPAVLPNLAPQAARRDRNDDVFLVNIKPNVGDTEAYCVVPGQPKCGIFPDQAAARGYDRAGDGQGTLADRISTVVPRRGELCGVFVHTALAGRLRLPGVRQGSCGGAEEPGVHIRMLRLWPANLDHGGHSAAPHQAAADGLVLGRASDVDTFQRNVGTAVGGSARPHL